jgi:ribosomal protein L11 methylase PrmA
MINPQLQAYFCSQQQQQHSQSSSSLFSPNLVNDPAIVYQQQPPSAVSHIQRSVSTTNQQPLFDDIQRSFRQVPSQPNISSFFGTNVSNSQSQKSDDIITRLAQAMQSHGQQQQDKVEEQRRLEQQRREIELERLKLAQQAEQLRLQREEDERRQVEQQQQRRLEEELRKKKEAVANKQNILDQMKEMAKTIDQKKQQQQLPVQPQSKVEIDPFLAFQQSVQFQKEQQAKIEAQK